MKRDSKTPSLFEAMEIEEDKAKPECPHRNLDKGERIYPDEPNVTRLIWVCKACKETFGRA